MSTINKSLIEISETIEDDYPFLKDTDSLEERIIRAIQLEAFVRDFEVMERELADLEAQEDSSEFEAEHEGDSFETAALARLSL